MAVMPSTPSQTPLMRKQWLSSGHRVRMDTPALALLLTGQLLSCLC